MFKIKNTGKAIGISAVIVCVCFAMLLGTTFAWFTDNAQTKVNVIKTGDFDINILEVSSIGVLGNTLVGESLDFVDAAGNALNVTLWEPGMTIRSQTFAIKNEGDYALKFKIDGVFAGATTSGGEDLREVIGYKIVRVKYDAQSDSWSTVETYMSCNENMFNTDNAGADRTLAPEESMFFYIEFHMIEGAANKYQDCELKDLAISVSAAQHTYEQDYNGSNYDANADYDKTATPGPNASEVAVNP